MWDINDRIKIDDIPEWLFIKDNTRYWNDNGEYCWYKGEHVYVVALWIDKDNQYADFQYIRANSGKEAQDLYNKINDCEYCYGMVIGEIKRYPS